MNKLYHKDVYIPENLTALQRDKVFLNMTTHAHKAANSDRYGRIFIPSTAAINPDSIVELETNKAENTLKIVARLPYNKEYDLVTVLLFSNVDLSAKLVNLAMSSTVKTVWLNCKNDQHTTLDESRYARN